MSAKWIHQRLKRSITTIPDLQEEVTGEIEGTEGIEVEGEVDKQATTSTKNNTTNKINRIQVVEMENHSGVLDVGQTNISEKIAQACSQETQ